MMERRSRRLLLLRRHWEPRSEKANPARATEIQKRRRDLGYLTRLRTCTEKGVPCAFSGPPEAAPKGCLPWFEVPGRRSRELTVVCGHWAALGLRIQPGLVALDSGCAWGNGLCAIRLEDGKVFRQETVEKRFWP